MADDKQIGADTRMLAAVFCPGCGTRFLPQLEPKGCPTCGQGTPHPGLVATHLSQHALNAAQAVEVDTLIGRDFGVYHLENLLGAGAMGRVYLARHRDLHRSIALKILPPRLSESDPAYLERFQNEGRAAAALVHPNVITVHAIGEIDGYHFLEMEFVAGQSLGQWLKDNGALTPERATTIAARIADGLAIAHSHNILHRDLKPDNVLMTHLGVPKIADFGLAKRVLADSAILGELVGTPAFMAPELFRGEQASAASDVYALGVCYYQMLTGRLPYPAEEMNELIRSVTLDDVPSPRPWCPELPLEMAECLYTLLAKTPANRPKDAWAASQLLQAVLGEVEDLETQIQQAFVAHLGVSWRARGSGFELRLVFANGRKQTVFIEPSDHAASERLLRIRSLCGRAEPAYLETALRLNAEILHGALCIQEIEGEPTFVMVDSYPRATVDVEEIRRSVLEVAHRADAVEQFLTGCDRH